VATILDVARMARVSPSSVSNFFNNRLEKMTPDTRQRIERAVVQLGYKPNRAARQLKTGHAPILGLLVPSVANPFFGEIATATQRAAQARGYQLILCNTFRDPGREREFAEELAAFGVRGVITGSSLLNPKHLTDLANRGLAVVTFEGDAALPGRKGVDVVSIDNAMATAIAVDHLVGLGHERITYVTAPGQTAARAARLHGFKAAMQRHGLGRTARVHEIALPPSEYGDDMIAELGIRAAPKVAKQRRPATAVIAMNDLLAIGLAAGLREQGLDIPGDVSLVGIDDLFLARLMNPPMTSVRQPLALMAGAAIDCLADRIEGVTDAFQRHIFSPELVVRQSTAPAGL
jgi:DNA-binding LacI/PurR family transcriptional regulator